MRSIMIVGLIVLNVVLAAAVFATAQRQPVTSLWEDCCKDAGPGAYCCRNCCFLGSGCGGCMPN